jgi:hypothetical protein
VLGPSALMLISLFAHVGGPFMELPAPPAPPVGITMADNTSSIAAGQTVRYRVTVKATESSSVTIRLTVPPGTMSSLTTTDAAVIANAVAWKADLIAGETRTFFLAGTVAPGSAESLEAVACVHLNADAPALTCASDRNNLQNDHLVRDYAWIASIILGLVAVLGALWLHRRIRPEFLTPANATLTIGVPPVSPSEFPGGSRSRNLASTSSR